MHLNFSVFCIVNMHNYIIHAGILLLNVSWLQWPGRVRSRQMIILRMKISCTNFLNIILKKIHLVTNYIAILTDRAQITGISQRTPNFPVFRIQYYFYSRWDLTAIRYYVFSKTLNLFYETSAFLEKIWWINKGNFLSIIF